MPRRASHHTPAPAPGWPLLGALLACIAALLSGCGPGVGGTGTGGSLTAGDALAAYGASVTPLCGSTLAGGLQCSSTASGAAPAAAPLQFLADDAVAARAVARVAGDGIELELACERLRFAGTWGTVPGQPARFYGVVQRLADGEVQLASLAAQPDGAGFTLSLVSATGAPLAPPRLLRPVPAAPPRACPG